MRWWIVFISRFLVIQSHDMWPTLPHRAAHFASSVLHCSYSVHMVCFCKQFCLICPEDILPEEFRLVSMHLANSTRFFMICFQRWSPCWSSSIKSTLAQTVMDDAIWHWCSLTLEFTSCGMWVISFFTWSIPLVLSTYESTFKHIYNRFLHFTEI